MSDSTLYLGLDYHDAFIQACLIDADGRVLANRKCANDALGLTRLVPEGTKVQVAIEACNGTADLADQLAEHPGWSVHLAHPLYVHKLKQSPDKTDWSDARLLGDLVRVGYLPKVWLPPAPIRELRRLMRFRQTLVDDRRNVKLRIGALLRDHRVKRSEHRRWTAAWRTWTCSLTKLGRVSRWVLDRQWKKHDDLSAQIKEVEAMLEAQTAEDPVVEKLQEQPGVGLIIACMLRAEVGRFDRFTNGKQLARFCGLSPKNASSGQRQADAGLMNAANRRLRAMLIEAGWMLIRYDLRWKTMANAMVRRGKPKCVVVAAVANRWVRSLHHQMCEAGVAMA